MAITTNTDLISFTRSAADTTAGNEVMFKTKLNAKYRVEVIGSGAGALKTSGMEDTPTNFDNFSGVYNADVTENASWIVEGSVWVAFEVSSGTWTVNVVEF